MRYNSCLYRFASFSSILLGHKSFVSPAAIQLRYKCLFTPIAIQLRCIAANCDTFAMQIYLVRTLRYICDAIAAHSDTIAIQLRHKCMLTHTAIHFTTQLLLNAIQSHRVYYNVHMHIVSLITIQIAIQIASHT